MFQIDPTTLYSLEDLEREMDALGLTVRQFLDQVRPPKLFRTVWRGADILEALDRYRDERDADRRALRLPRRSGRPRKADNAGVELIPLPTK